MNYHLTHIGDDFVSTEVQQFIDCLKFPFVNGIFKMNPSQMSFKRLGYVSHTLYRCANNGPIGDPLAKPSFCLYNILLNKNWVLNLQHNIDSLTLPIRIGIPSPASTLSRCKKEIFHSLIHTMPQHRWNRCLGDKNIISCTSIGPFCPLWLDTLGKIYRITELWSLISHQAITSC